MKSKILASILAILLAGISLTPALALDLGDFPDVFTSDDGLVDIYIVVGKDAKPEDVVGAVDLAMRLAGVNSELIPIEVGGEITGGYTKDIELGDFLTPTMKSILTDRDVSNLFDGEVTFDGDEYEVHEEIRLGNNKLKVETSLGGDDDYDADPYLEVGVNDIKYMYVFDDEIDTGDINDDTYLDVEILGQNMKIVDFGNDEITVRLAEERTMVVGDSEAVDGYTIELKNVNDVAALIKVTKGSSTETKTVNAGTERSILGLDVRVESVWNEEIKADRSAQIAFGPEVTKTYKDGDAFIGQDEDEPVWVWDITCSNDAVEEPEIGVAFDQNLDDLSDGPIGVDDEIALPNNYAKVMVREVTVDDYATFRVYHEDSMDLSDLGYGSSENVFALRSIDEDEGFFLDSDDAGTAYDIYTSTIYLYQNAGDVEVLYLDEDDNDIHKSTIEADDGITSSYVADLEYGDTTAQIWVTEATGDIFVLFPNGELLEIDANPAMTQLGTTSDDAEASDVQVDGSNIGTRDDSVLTTYGAIIKDIESNANNDEVEFEVPEDQVEVTVSIAPGSVEVTDTEEFVRNSIPIKNYVAKLDTEVSFPVNKHIITIGGPAVNRVAARAMGVAYPTYGSSGLMPYAENQGYVELIPDALEPGYNTLIVSGWFAGDTRNACRAVQLFDDNMEAFEGNTAVLVSTSGAITPFEAPDTTV